MRIFSLTGDNLVIKCSNQDHSHVWTEGYIDVDDEEGKHILAIPDTSRDIGLEPILNFTQWPETGKPPELIIAKAKVTKEIIEETE
jgi:hypothetical protein